MFWSLVIHTENMFWMSLVTKFITSYYSLIHFMFLVVFFISKKIVAKFSQCCCLLSRPVSSIPFVLFDHVSQLYNELSFLVFLTTLECMLLYDERVEREKKTCETTWSVAKKTCVILISDTIALCLLGNLRISIRVVSCSIHNRCRRLRGVL